MKRERVCHTAPTITYGPQAAWLPEAFQTVCLTQKVAVKTTRIVDFASLQPDEKLEEKLEERLRSGISTEQMVEVSSGIMCATGDDSRKDSEDKDSLDAQNDSDLLPSGGAFHRLARFHIP